MLHRREESFIVALDVFIDAAPARTWHCKPIVLKTLLHDFEQLNYNSIQVMEVGERYIQYKAKKTGKMSV